MLTKNGARLQVYLELRRKYGLQRGPEGLIILDDHTIERPWGWVFFYTTRGWHAGDLKYAVGGNVPYFVDRFDETVDTLPHSLERFLKLRDAQWARTQKQKQPIVGRLHDMFKAFIRIFKRSRTPGNSSS